MFTMAGAVTSSSDIVTCSICGDDFYSSSDVGYGEYTFVTYQQKYSVETIPSLTSSSVYKYTLDNDDNHLSDLYAAFYNGSAICRHCLEDKIAEYKAANANNLSAPGTGNTPITVTAAASTFNVTVPTSIPLVVNADGTVTAPTGVKLVNGSAGSVQVSSIAMNNGDWALTDYNGGNRSKLAEAKVDSKKLGLSLAVTGNAAVTSKDGSQNPTIDTSKWTMPGGSELPISVGAIATASSTKVTAEVTAANVVFTLAWK